MGMRRYHTFLTIENAPDPRQISFIGLRDENNLVASLLMKMPDQMKKLTREILVHEQETQDDRAFWLAGTQRTAGQHPRASVRDAVSANHQI